MYISQISFCVTFFSKKKRLIYIWCRAQFFFFISNGCCLLEVGREDKSVFLCRNLVNFWLPTRLPIYICVWVTLNPNKQIQVKMFQLTKFRINTAQRDPSNELLTSNFPCLDKAWPTCIYSLWIRISGQRLSQLGNGQNLFCRGKCVEFCFLSCDAMNLVCLSRTGVLSFHLLN